MRDLQPDENGFYHFTIEWKPTEYLDITVNRAANGELVFDGLKLGKVLVHHDLFATFMGHSLNGDFYPYAVGPIKQKGEFWECELKEPLWTDNGFVWQEDAFD